MATNATPSWPSLYNLGLEIGGLEHHDAVQPGGHYLYKPRDMFLFTLYWTIIFYTPIFIVCGAYAFVNLTFPPSPSSVHNAAYELEPLSSSHEDELLYHPSLPPKTPRVNEGRSRLTFALLVLLTFLALSIAGAVIAAAIGGFVLAGLYSAANFNMSTWVPLLWAVIQVLVGLLGIWPSIIDII